MSLPESSFKLWLLVSGFFVARYFVMAGIPFLFFYVYGSRQVKGRKIQKKVPSRKKILKEICYSLGSLFIYGSGIWLFLIWLDTGNTLHYEDVTEYGIPYFIVSILLMILLHDTYFYWTHRLIHHRFLFRYVHKVHHQFSNPTPWAAFSFHPLEAILSMGVIPIIIFCIPWHQSALIIFISFMTLYDVYIHLGYDLKQLRLGQWQNTAADHNHHHQNAVVNFGLYFRIWDEIMGTYEKLPKRTS